MAENNRNRQGSYRHPNEWNDEYGRQYGSFEEEPNYTISENRGYRGTGRHSERGDGGWKSRYERELDDQREGDFSGYNRRRERKQESGYPYNPTNPGLTSGYSDFGGDYSTARSGSRNLYDRGNQGTGRRDYENRENRIGGANYDAYGDRGRYEGDSFYRGQGRFSSDNYAERYNQRGRRSFADRNEARGDYRDRGYGGNESNERSWWDRTTDEVSSWFGDEEAERRRESDRMQRGQYRGIGPRNYSRSDDRIREDVNDRLSDDPFVDATDVEVAVHNGDVTLTGTVDHRSSKRRAEDLAESVSGVKNVENRLRVVSASTTVSGINEPSRTPTPQSSSPVPGSDRSRTKEGLNQ